MNFFTVVSAFMLVTVLWSIAGLIADIITSKIYAWIQRRKKISGKKINLCPMLECRDSGCCAYDKEALQCRYAEIGLDLDQEVSE